jgi:CRISPR-associated protein Csh2
VIKNNREFLLIYDASLCNPNGDSDDNNMPRMDYVRQINLVSDVRVKRDSREVLKHNGEKIFVDLLDGRKVTNENMLMNYLEEIAVKCSKLPPKKKKKQDKKGKDEEENKEENKEESKEESKEPAQESKISLKDYDPVSIQQYCMKNFADIRLFGHTMAIPGVNAPITGPVQMSWGFSLHPVDIVESNSITSIMNDGNSTFGKSNKVYYSMISHYGTISKINAAKTKLTEVDLDFFRESLINGISNSLTTSKLGKSPLLYIEVEHEEDSNFFIGDLRRFIKTTYEKKVRTYRDVSVDLTDVSECINAFPKVKCVHVWQHPTLKLYNVQGLDDFNKGLPLELKSPEELKALRKLEHQK